MACAGNPDSANISTGVSDETDSASVDTLVSDTLLPYKGDSLYAFYGDNESYGFMNSQGIVVIKPRFIMAGDFYGGVAPVATETEHGFCDSTGKMITVFDGFEFYIQNGDYVTGFLGKEGFYVVHNSDEKWGYVNSRGELITDLIYDDVSEFSEGKAVVHLNEKAGFIDTNGTEVIPLNYEHAWAFSEDLAAVRIDDKTGFIDHTGKLVIPAIYEEAYAFSEGLCIVTRSANYSNYYYIDQTGKTIIPGPYEQGGNFYEGKAYVSKRGFCRIIDTSGKELEKLDYDCFGGC
jgi:hypothetical protein